MTNSENLDQVFAWGMELTFDDPGTEVERRVALTYVPGFHTGKDVQGRHSSAETARDIYSRALPINLALWEPGRST